jgi:hypothetical protein
MLDFKDGHFITAPIAINGRYWTSSVDVWGPMGVCLYFTKNVITNEEDFLGPSNSHNFPYGMAIRCVPSSLSNPK